MTLGVWVAALLIATAAFWVAVQFAVNGIIEWWLRRREGGGS